MRAFLAKKKEALSVRTVLRDAVVAVEAPFRESPPAVFACKAARLSPAAVVKVT